MEKYGIGAGIEDTGTRKDLLKDIFLPLMSNQILFQTLYLQEVVFQSIIKYLNNFLIHLRYIMEQVEDFCLNLDL